jgi:putative ABC transport system permease protein
VSPSTASSRRFAGATRSPRWTPAWLSVLAAQTDLLDAVGGRLERGRFLDDALDQYPVVVLGHDAATQLGIDLEVTPTIVSVGRQDFVVAGILRPVGLAPELDRAALIGFPAAAAELIGPGGAAE